MQAESIPQRKYALTRIGPGDYLLPSNDAQTIWRIAKYVDGPSHGGYDLPRDREFWGLWKWDSPIRMGGSVDTQSWDRWTHEGAHFDTRREAIDDALRMGG